MTSEASRAAAEPTYDHPFWNPELPIEERIDDLVARLTRAEKIECMGTDPSVPRLGIAATDHVEGLHGLALGGPGRWGGTQPITTTTFPQAIGLAQTWNPELVKAVAAVEAHEARYAFQRPDLRRGGLVVRAPNADLGRDPRWGRTEECYGEDAFLAGTLATSFVRGLQGDDARYWKAAALLKHFFANSNENGRERTSSDFDECLFREYYSVPFRMAVEEGGARAYMAAYNAYNGVPCTTHPVLRAVTVAEWRQDGIICTDAGALKMLVTEHRSQPDPYHAAAAAVRAGITQFLDDYRDALGGALERGLLVEADLDRALRGNFRVMIRLGLLDPPTRVPYARIGCEGEPEPWLLPDARACVLRATEESIVLLDNDGTLPLEASALRTVAVVGPLADRVMIDWYSGTPPYTVTPLDGIRERLGPRVTVRQATANDDSDAIRIARESDVCVVCVGNHPTGDGPWAQVTRASYGREAVDRRAIDLEDERLVRDVLAANPRTVVVLVASFPYAVPWTREHAAAVVLVTHNSQELGTALARVLFGDVNPGGRLVQTWPKAAADLPPLMDYDLRHGRTYMFSTVEPLYPFGHGLSYTTFEYLTIATSSDVIDIAGCVVVSVGVANRGARGGDEVVQLFVRRAQRTPRDPVQALKAFARVRLAAGEARVVDLAVRGRDLATWDPTSKSFGLPAGEIELRVGGSSAAIALTRTLRAT
jgi:beta-glucosidase